MYVFTFLFRMYVNERTAQDSKPVGVLVKLALYLYFVLK